MNHAPYRTPPLPPTVPPHNPYPTPAYPLRPITYPPYPLRPIACPQKTALKSSGEKRDAEMQSEMDIATASRAKAEAAKRKSEEMLAKELSMKKDGEADLRECEKVTLMPTLTPCP